MKLEINLAHLPPLYLKGIIFLATSRIIRQVHQNESVQVQPQLYFKSEDNQFANRFGFSSTESIGEDLIELIMTLKLELYVHGNSGLKRPTFELSCQCNW